MDNKVFLFPLSNSILFKKVTLPFHIFEPRYREMVRVAIQDEVPIAIVPFHPSNAYQGQVCVAGLAHVLTTYPDGRMDIFITGTVKCRLTQFIYSDPFFVFNYEVLEEDNFLGENFEIEKESLKAFIEQWAKQFVTDPSQRAAFTDSLKDDEALVNYCSLFLVDDIKVRASLMKAESIQHKVKILLKAIGPKEVSLGPFMPVLKF